MVEYRSVIAGLTVGELKELLKAAGLAISGKKEQMVDRLVDYYNEEVRDSYRSMTIAELKELLKAAGLRTAGRKKTLWNDCLNTTQTALLMTAHRPLLNLLDRQWLPLLSVSQYRLNYCRTTSLSSRIGALTLMTPRLPIKDFGISLKKSKSV